MKSIILYRDDADWQIEKEAAAKYFPCVKSRMEIKKDDLVIARFSALPFYKEQEYDINYVGAKMINTYRQHRYIADLGNWVNDLEDLTPKTWNRLQDIPEEGPFILKGETNSKKYQWKTHMYASNKREAIDVESKLNGDSLITYQNIYIRQYVPLKTFTVGFQGLPITNEYRFFCYKDKILSGGYYWSSHTEELLEMGIKPDVKSVPEDFLNKVINRVKDNVNYYVIDVAETQSGEWIVIELNDGQCSGISDNDPEVIYKNLKYYLSTNT
jgi:hypothetical protein